MKSSASFRHSQRRTIGGSAKTPPSRVTHSPLSRAVGGFVSFLKANSVASAVLRHIDLNSRSSWWLLITSTAATLSSAAATTIGAGAANETNGEVVKAVESGMVPSGHSVMHTQQMLVLWAAISQTLWWTVLIVSGCSIPILLHALYSMLTKYKRSNYFDFMTAMIICNVCMITSIISNLISDEVPGLQGSVMCKITAFVTNTTTCYVNWLWVMMFSQRFAHIFFSVHRPKSGGLTLFEDTRRLLIITGIVSLITQVWAPILMKQLRVANMNGGVEAVYCGADSSLINPELFKWIAVAESCWTYVIPLLITVLTDIAVLAFTRESKWFTTVTSQAIKHSDVQMPLSLKIQSEEGLRASNKRRRQAVRRCLVLATTQLMLNVPNYVLQLVDEFTTMRSSDLYITIYLWADAIFYVIYLLQFPALAVFVRLLHSNYEDRNARRRSAYRRQRQLGEDSHSMTESSRKRCSTEMETVGRHSARTLV
ncbi:G-PROTEIN-RECEP-F1-2 domain-containing protein [Aphelenchoides fujianensis]|nr:G-PROTEIN-RECEP-F1-2 domain-containing protein [Aphelenchoides fujianensis]